MLSSFSLLAPVADGLTARMTMVAALLFSSAILGAAWVQSSLSFVISCFMAQSHSLASSPGLPIFSRCKRPGNEATHSRRLASVVYSYISKVTINGQRYSAEGRKNAGFIELVVRRACMRVRSRTRC